MTFQREVIGATNSTGIITFCSRHRSDDPGSAEELRTAIATAHQIKPEEADASFLAFDCLGRADAFCVLRTRQLDFYACSLLPPLRSVKKLDVQYAYASDNGADAFWAAAHEAEQDGVLLLSTTLKLRDDLLLAAGERLRDDVVAALATRSRRYGLTPLIGIGLGWPDVLLLTLGSDLDTLSRFACEDVWPLRICDLSEDVRDHLSASPEAKAVSSVLGPLKYDEVVLSRTFSLFGVPTGGDAHEVAGSVYAPRIELRTRPGAERQVRTVVDKVAKTAEFPYALQMTIQPGLEDVSIVVVGTAESGGQPTGAVPAGVLLPWYLRTFCPAVSTLATTTELHLGLSSHPLQECKPARDCFVFPSLAYSVPATNKADGSPETGPDVAALTAALGVIEWGMGNDAIYLSLADTYLLAQGFLSVGDVGGEEGASRGVQAREAARLGARFMAEAVDQRLAGTYYDYSSDRRQTLPEYAGSIHKILGALWAVQQVTLIAAAQIALSRTESTHQIKRTAGTWAISRDGLAGEILPHYPAYGFRISSPLAFELERGIHAVCHEVGHAVFDLITHKYGRAVEPGECRWLEEHEEALEAFHKFQNANWREIAWMANSEVFADVFAFALFLDGNFDAYADSMTDVLRATEGGRVNLAHVAIRMWAVNRCDREMSPMRSQQILWLPYESFSLGADGAVEMFPFQSRERPRAPDAASEEIELLALEQSWDDLYARLPHMADILQRGREIGERLGFLQPSMLRCFEASCQNALVLAAMASGVDGRMPGDPATPVQRDLQEICALFTNRLRLGGSLPGWRVKATRLLWSYFLDYMRRELVDFVTQSNKARTSVSVE